MLVIDYFLLLSIVFSLAGSLYLGFKAVELI